MKIKSVSAIIKNKEGMVLLLKRGTLHKFYNGFWQLPEGKVEKGETEENAIIRELKEETDQIPIQLRYLFNKETHINNQNMSYIIDRFVFEASCGDDIKLSPEHSEFSYFSPKSMDKLELVPGTKEIIDML